MCVFITVHEVTSVCYLNVVNETLGFETGFQKKSPTNLLGRRFLFMKRGRIRIRYRGLTFDHRGVSPQGAYVHCSVGGLGGCDQIGMYRWGCGLFVGRRDGHCHNCLG